MAAVHRKLRRNRRYNKTLPRPRVFRDRLDPLAVSDEELFDRYRFRRPTILFLLRKLGDRLTYKTKRNSPLSPLLQILLCLRFLSSGASHILIGDSLRVSENAAGRAIRKVPKAICSVLKDNIVFPTGQQAKKVMEAFWRIAGFPKVLGCVDGTFIKIKPPKENEQDFVNRKGFHSLNVQMVCDPNFKITSASINWPGSTHDARVWRSSDLCRQFENGNHNGILLGDSGYPCTVYLMTPFPSPRNQQEENFNTALCRTRVLIEQTYGILKKRFQALHYGLRTTTDRAVYLILSSVILHNIGIDRGDIMTANDYRSFHESECTDIQLPTRADGRNMRNEIANRFF